MNFTCQTWTSSKTQARVNIFLQPTIWESHSPCWPAMAIFSKPARLPAISQARRRPLILAAFVLLLLRSRIGSLGKEGIDAVSSRLLKGKSSSKKLSAEENLQVLQKIYEQDGDAEVLLVPYRDRITKVSLVYFEYIDADYL